MRIHLAALVQVELQRPQISIQHGRRLFTFLSQVFVQVLDLTAQLLVFSEDTRSMRRATFGTAWKDRMLFTFLSSVSLFPAVRSSPTPARSPLADAPTKHIMRKHVDHNKIQVSGHETNLFSQFVELQVDVGAGRVFVLKISSDAPELGSMIQLHFRQLNTQQSQTNHDLIC